MTKKIQFTHHDYEIVSHKLLYQGVFRLFRYDIRQRLFNGGWSEVYQREILERQPAAAVLPYDPKLDRVILIEQFRPGSLSDPMSPWMIEIPAGVFSKSEEQPDGVARREAMEEAGCHILDLELICESFVSAGCTNEYINIFCGRVDASQVNGIHGLAHEHEDIRVINISSDAAFDQLNTGKIKTTPAIIGLLWLQLHRQRLQKMWK